MKILFYEIRFRICFEMAAEFYYGGFSRRFRLSKRKHSGVYATDERDENDRKDAERKENNHFKTDSYLLTSFTTFST